MIRRDRKTRALAWLLTIGVTVTSMPSSIYAEEFSDGQDFMEDSSTNFVDYEEEPGSGVDPGEGSGAGNQAGTGEESAGDPSSDTGYRDAEISISWSDEGNIAGRRPEIKDLLEIYADGALVNNDDFEIVLSEESPVTEYGLETCRYTVKNLPVYQEDGVTEILYRFGEKEERIPGYTGVTAELLSGAENPEEALGSFASPGETVDLSLSEDSGRYTGSKRFGNYLPAYQVSGSITWNDENDRDKVRPDMESYFADQFVIARSQENYPAARVTYSADENDGSHWNFSVKGLFTTRESGEKASYNISAGSFAGYDVETNAVTVEADETNISFVYNYEAGKEESANIPVPGKGYSLKLRAAAPADDNLNQRVEVKTGSDALTEEQKSAIQSAFRYIADGNEYSSIESLRGQYGSADVEWTWSENTAACTITGIPGDNEGNPVVCSIRYVSPEEREDQFVSAYDTESGNIILTRTGTTSFFATKKWLDNTDTTRPTTTWTLYRTTKTGEGYAEPEAVTADEQTVTWKLKTSAVAKQYNDRNTTETVAVNAQGTVQGATMPSGGTVDVLPKYDAEGKEYIYLVKEEMTGSTAGDFRAHYSSLSEGTFSEADKLTINGVDYLKNGGEMSNLLYKTTSATARKTWIAEQYKDQLSDVKVTVTLQSRRVGEENENAWENVKTTEGGDRTLELTDFSSENRLTKTGEITDLPQYDPEGKKLEYRFAETSVTVGSDTFTGKTDKDLDGDGMPDTYYQLPVNTSAASTGEE